MRAKRALDSAAQPGAAVDHDQDAAVGGHAARSKIGKQRPAQRRVFRRTLADRECVLLFALPPSWHDLCKGTGEMKSTSVTAQRIRKRLDARRRDLLGRYKDALDRAETELGVEHSDLIDVGNDQWDSRVLAVMSEHDALALENIDAALHRFDAGDYGVCTSCGADVSPVRLQILPEVGQCAPCAADEALARPRVVDASAP
jgi:RNA polymerase-binding transcription factor DksA